MVEDEMEIDSKSAKSIFNLKSMTVGQHLKSILKALEIRIDDIVGAYVEEKNHMPRLPHVAKKVDVDAVVAYMLHEFSWVDGVALRTALLQLIDSRLSRKK